MNKLTGVAALGAVSVLAAISMAADSTTAVSRTSHNLLGEGVGLVAYDPVSYFPEGGSKPEKGLISISVDHERVTYRFASERHKALDTRAKFLESPEAMLAKAEANWPKVAQ